MISLLRTKRHIILGISCSIMVLLSGGYSQENQKSFPEEAKKFYRKGLLYHEKGDLLKAIALYNKAIRVAPKYWETYVSRARAYEILKLYDCALKDYSTAIQLNPQSPGVWHIRGCFFYEYTNEFSKAIDDFNQAIKIDFQFIFAYSMKATTYKKMGKIDLAIEEYKIGIQVAQNMEGAQVLCAELYNNSAFLYQEKKDIDKAIEYFSKAIFYDPTVSSYYIARGSLRLKKGDIKGHDEDIAMADELEEAEIAKDINSEEEKK